jgi:hypothetical protein
LQIGRALYEKLGARVTAREPIRSSNARRSVRRQLAIGWHDAMDKAAAKNGLPFAVPLSKE